MAAESANTIASSAMMQIVMPGPVRIFCQSPLVNVYQAMRPERASPTAIQP